MSPFSTAVFLLSCQSIIVFALTEDTADIMNRTTDDYLPGMDLVVYGKLCNFIVRDGHFGNVLMLGENKKKLGYATEIYWGAKKLGCTAYRSYSVTYPPLAGTDPMMPFYINVLRQGFAITPGRSIHLSALAPVQRWKEYCATMRVVSEYGQINYFGKIAKKVEDTKIVETVTKCVMFRQVRDMYLSKLYEKLCLDEDGCYNVMEYYEEDLPYCVKYSAISQFKNSSVGSWHRTIVNYCKLTATVFGGEDTKYDLKLLTQKGRTRENLRQMCLYLKYRLLPEEGKEQEIPDEIMDEYDTSDIETTTGEETQVGVSFFTTTTSWSMIFLAIA